MGLVIVGIAFRINCRIIDGVSTGVVEETGGIGREELRRAVAIGSIVRAVELHVAHRVTGNGLIDTHTHLRPETAELDGDRVVAILCLLPRHDVGYIAAHQVGRPARVGISGRAERRGIDGRHQHLAGGNSAGGGCLEDGRILSGRPGDEVVLRLAVVPVFHGLTGDAVVDGMCGKSLAHILPVPGVRLSGVGRVLLVFDEIIVEDDGSATGRCRTFEARYHKLVVKQVGCFRTDEIGTGGAFGFQAKHNRCSLCLRRVHDRRGVSKLVAARGKDNPSHYRKKDLPCHTHLCIN